MVVVYTEIDRVCHYYWHGLDDRHPEHAQTAPKDESVIADIYAEIDEAFAAILGLVDDDCVVMVVSDHGFGPCTRSLRIHRVLADGGFCVPHSTGDLIMPSLKVQTDYQVQTDYLKALDWHHTTVYMPTPGCFGVNLNLQGRQVAGTVATVDKEAVLGEVRAYLLGLSDPNTGSPVFEAVIPAETAYSGAYMAYAPDLLLVPADPALKLLPSLHGPTWDKADWTGLHRLEGIWMLRAPHTQAGNQAEVMAIEAVASHLLATLGMSSDAIPTPDGTLSANAAPFAAGLPTGAWSVARDVARCWPAHPHTGARIEQTGGLPTNDSIQQTIAHTDSEVIAERLRLMGYL
jgi:predicted AlkP superfamily phosphohydrolase/phosphomutase